MTEKRFVKYDGNTIVDLKLVKSWIISNGNVELLLEILNNEKTSKKEIIRKRCTDCKHTKGIGFDFWCGEGHTEYEVFIGETNCPYFEYHDWSKDTPSKAEKRFTKYVPDSYGYTYITTIIDNEKNKQTGNTDEIVDMLNDLSEENKQLKKLLECSREEANDYCEELMGKDEFIRLYKSQRDDAIKENEQLQIKNNAHLQDIEVYREENTHLKLENDKLKQDKTNLHRAMSRDRVSYLNEIEQLKSEIKDLNDVLARYEEKELQRND